MTRYDKTRAAIAAAISAGDPGSKVYDRWRYPKRTAWEGWLELLGVDGALKGWMFSRTGVPQSVNLEESYGGNASIVSEQETWLINGWRTLKDDPPTEYDFQNAVDSVKSMLRNHGAIREMLHAGDGVTDDGYVDTIRVDEISEVEFANERYAHRAQITVIFSFPRALA